MSAQFDAGRPWTTTPTAHERENCELTPEIGDRMDCEPAFTFRTALFKDASHTGQLCPIAEERHEGNRIR
jgi:hypothetical protein